MEATSVPISRAQREPLRSRRHQLRTIHVIAAAEFKLKYSGSALGYLWSILKPLALFTMLYIIFGHMFKLTSGIKHYPIYLLMGIVIWTYFTDATVLAMNSIFMRRSLISKLAFPRLVIPISMTVSTGFTFCVNLLTIAAFIAINRIAPGPKWLLLPLLLVELYLVTVGVSLILAPIYVRFHDMGQVWELLVQLLFYASPIIYPANLLPEWFRPIAFLSPLVQIIQDARTILIPSSANITAADAYGTPLGELVPIGIGLLLLVVGFLFFRREEPWFAERT